MFSKRYFVIKNNFQMIQEASVKENFIDLENFPFVKAPFWKFWILHRVFKFLLFKGYSTNYELFRIKAHLLDLLELNLSYFEKRKAKYHERILEFENKIDPSEKSNFEFFIHQDLNLLAIRAESLIRKYTEKIRSCENIDELYKIKADLISNTFLISYRVKVPYKF